jgi:hypothetical protein
MNWSHVLNIFGLALSAIAAFLMAWFPPRVVQYYEDGSAPVIFTSKPTAEGKIKGRHQSIYGKAGPWMLWIGFLFQLAAAGIG